MKWMTLLAPIALASLAACADAPSHLPYGSFVDQFNQVSPPRSRAVAIQVELGPVEKIRKACGGHDACAFHPAGDRKTWLVFVRAPADWDDERAIEALGHEVLHALGAEHRTRHVTTKLYGAP